MTLLFYMVRAIEHQWFGWAVFSVDGGQSERVVTSPKPRPELALLALSRYVQSERAAKDLQPHSISSVKSKTTKGGFIMSCSCGWFRFVVGPKTEKAAREEHISAAGLAGRP